MPDVAGSAIVATEETTAPLGECSPDIGGIAVWNAEGAKSVRQVAVPQLNRSAKSSSDGATGAGKKSSARCTSTSKSASPNAMKLLSALLTKIGPAEPPVKGSAPDPVSERSAMYAR